MKIQFVLNYSEYRESQQGRFRRPDRSIRIGLAVVLLAVVLAGLVPGGLILLKGMPQSRLVGQIFLTIGALSAAALPLIWRWRKAREQQSIESAIRQEYEVRFREKQQEFEANEQGWSHRSEHGTEFRPWENLMGLWNGDRILTIAATRGVCILPKRSLSAGELAELSALADESIRDRKANILFEAHLEPSAVDYTLAAASRTWQYRGSGLFLLIGMALASAGFLADQLAHLGQPGADGGGWVLALGVLTISLWYLLTPLFSLLQYRSVTEEFPELNVQITPEAICIESAKKQTVWRYSQFQSFSHSARAFLLFFQDSRFLILPKRGFTPAQGAQFCEVLKSKLREQ